MYDIAKWRNIVKSGHTGHYIFLLLRRRRRLDGNWERE